MRNTRNLLLVLSIIFSIAGCTKEEPKKIQEIILTGLPISVEAVLADHDAQLVVIIRDIDGKLIICRANDYNDVYWYRPDVLEGKAIIQSEINDNDNETISLRGHFENGRYFFTSISANGWTVDAKK